MDYTADPTDQKLNCSRLKKIEIKKNYLLFFRLLLIFSNY